MSDTPALRFDGVSKRYKTATAEVLALDDISFSLASASTMAIVGPSGSGKTTLLGLAAGLDNPSSGKIWLGEQEISTMDEDQRAVLRAQQIGFVFQQYQLISSLTALDNVTLPLEIQGKLSLAEIRNRANTLLEQVGLTSRTTHFPGQLSGGEQQRVALARAFINHPAVLFADEPTGNLDAENAEMAISLIFDLRKLYNTAIVLVTHDPSLAERAEHRLELTRGRMRQ